VTRAIDVIGAAYDLTVALPASLCSYYGKLPLVRAAIERATLSGDTLDIQLASWEQGLLQFCAAPRTEGGHFGGQEYETFASQFDLTPDTLEYSLERARETCDIVLRTHYLAFAVERMPATGRRWVECQRELIATLREYVDAMRTVRPGDPGLHIGLFIDDALIAIGRLAKRPGVLRDEQLSDLANWIVQLAVDIRDVPGDDKEPAGFWYHRWASSFLRILAQLPASASDAAARLTSIRILDDARQYYAADPLADTFSNSIAELEYELRSHWGGRDLHEAMTREKFATLLRRAEFHKSKNDNIVALLFFRAARELVERERKYFTEAEVSSVMLEEQAAISGAVTGGEFQSVGATVEVRSDMLDRTRGTAEETVAALLAEVALPIPTVDSLRRDIDAMADGASLQHLFARMVVSDGKVVGESAGTEKNLELAVEELGLRNAAVGGEVMAHTIVHAAAKVNLTVDDLIAPLASLKLDGGTTDLIRHGIDLIVSEDWISACHVLVPRVEDVVRRFLRARGHPATELKRNGDGTFRTDDASLGAMLASSLPSGPTVESCLGVDFTQFIKWTMLSQTGLNLRNTFAHGQARPGHCRPWVAGVVLIVLYKLASLPVT
jgi:hypothetical protein